jgi:hypothetical protein
MPLTCCPTCGLTVYSAAGHSTRDECPQCASELPPMARVANGRFSRVRGLAVRALQPEFPGAFLHRGDHERHVFVELHP